MKKIEIYVIKDNENLIYCIKEETAQAESQVKNLEYSNQKVNEKVFKRMIDENVFIDIDKYNEIENVVFIETEQTNDTLKTQGEDIELIKKQFQELLQQIEEVKQENRQLKSRPRINLEEAKMLYEKKNKLLINKSIFENSDKKIIEGLKKLDNIVDFEESNSFRLTLDILDHQQNGVSQLFGISNNLIIKKVLGFISSEIAVKVREITQEVETIENF